jgi:hypothetical protein
MFHKLAMSVVNYVDPFVVVQPQQPSPNAAAGSSWACSRMREMRIVVAAPTSSAGLTSRLSCVDYKRRERRRLDDHVLQQRERSQNRASVGGSRQLAAAADGQQVRIEFVVRLPESGIYRFEIFAMVNSPSGAKGRADDDDGDADARAASSRDADNVVPIYNYVIDYRDIVAAAAASGGLPSSSMSLHEPTSVCRMSQSLQPFPRQTDLWRADGCILHTPLDGRLVLRWPGDRMSQVGSDVGRRKRTVVFRLEVPRADKVAVVVGSGQWQYLERRPAVFSDSRLQLWQGEIELPVACTSDDGGGGHGRVATDRDARDVRERARSGTSMVTVEVCAHYPEGTASYRTLLEYAAEM